MAQERITVDPNRMRGLPGIRDTRVTVSAVLGQLAAGRSVDEVLADYPYLVVCKRVCFSLGALDAGEDRVGVLGPGKRPGVVVPVIDEGADGDDEFLDGGEGAAADGLAGDDREEALHQVEPGAAGRHEVQGDPLAGGAGKPVADVGVLVRG